MHIFNFNASSFFNCYMYTEILEYQIQDAEDNISAEESVLYCPPYAQGSNHNFTPVFQTN